ncbi:MAG TPA: PEP-CTERM system histidine kinase PrsK [Azonexus sp.]|nr:PEP-CTERM system histidine kinase PrsK [Azonexus sp.]
MENQTVSMMAWSMGIAAASYLLYAAYLVSLGHQWHKVPRSKAMLMAVLLTATWGILGNLFAQTGNVFYLLSSALVNVLRYGAWYIFLLLLLAPEGTTNYRKRPFGAWLIPLLWLVIVGGLVLHIGLGYRLLPTELLARATLFQALSMAVLGLMLIEQLFRNVSNDSLWNIKPLCLGLGSQFAFDLYLYSDALLFNQLDADAFAVRGFVQSCVIPLLLIATTRSRDWTAKIRLSQKAAFHTATLLIAGFYLLFVAGVGYYVRYFGGDWGRALQVALLFASVLALGILMFSGSMRAKLRVQVGKHFFSYRYDYREEWLRFTRTLSMQDSPQAMGSQVIRGLADMVESPAGGLWLRDPGQSAYTPAARWNIPALDSVETPESSLCQFLNTSGWVINLEEYRSFQGRYVDLEIPGWLSKIPDAWLIVPLMVSGEMTGFVILTSARTPIDVNWEVNDLLRTAGCQAAGFLARMQATEALLEARKFDAFNKMSAFVVHDLKNIITQLSLMLRNAERHRDNPEFQQDMLMTVEHSVERMRQLMMQLREGATPPGTPCGVSLPDVIERIRLGKMEQGRSIEIRVAERLTTRGHAERLERVIGHLVQNALDATDPTGHVWLSLERRGDRAALEVGDTGHGMTSEFIRERLFKPFQSTKQAGMGIGAYESAQYIKELGGEMQVESQENTGTRITIILPLFDLRTESDLREKESM